MRGNRKPSTEIRWRLAANLKWLREARGYTQMELAGRSGLPNRYISNVEQALKNISLANLEALAAGLKCLEVDLLMPAKKEPTVAVAVHGANDWPPPRENWIQRIDQARGIITLTVHTLLSDYGPDDEDVACSLNQVNQELQRLRCEIDESRIPKVGREDTAP
jgi:transcriptional regulator with XRE-family HTH domain